MGKIYINVNLLFFLSSITPGWIFTFQKVKTHSSIDRSSAFYMHHRSVVRGVYEQYKK